jgi:hypothetical protein
VLTIAAQRNQFYTGSVASVLAGFMEAKSFGENLLFQVGISTSIGELRLINSLL